LLGLDTPQTRPEGAVLAFMESEADLTTNLLMKRESPPDTDSPAFRMYQIPGTGHLLSAPLDESLRFSADRGELPPGISPYDKMNKPIIWGLWQNMYEWIEHGRPMPHAQHIVLDPSTPDGIARDKYGNAWAVFAHLGSMSRMELTLVVSQWRLR
jgi:hypothetical protein